MDPPREIIERLYALPPKRFVTERDAAAAEARAAGDRATAAAIAALRRPTVAAWVVNLLALRRPDLIAELAEFTTELQAAQRNLHGGTLRELAGRRRALVGSLVANARALAQETDPETGGRLPLAEVEATLQAAVADPEVAAQVRAGRLVRTADGAAAGAPAGAGGHLRLVTGTPSTDRSAAPPPPDPGAVARELAEARAAVAAAEEQLARVTEARQEAGRELAEIDAALADLQARREAAAGRLAEAEAGDLAARRAVRQAQQRVVRAEGAAAFQD